MSAAPESGMPSVPTTAPDADAASALVLSLADLPCGRPAVIESVDEAGPVGARLRDLGFIAGTPVRVVRRAPLGDPTLYALRGCEIALRRLEARRIRVRLAAPGGGGPTDRPA